MWTSGLRSNIETYSYPNSLRAEEESFIQDTLTSGDMKDFRSLIKKWGGENGAFYVAEIGGEVVACVGARREEGPSMSSQPAPVPRIYELGRFTVVSEVRGKKNLAPLLLEAAEKWASKDGGEVRIQATTVGLNRAAVKCYKKNGYSESFRGRRDGKKDEPDFFQVYKVINDNK